MVTYYVYTLFFFLRDQVMEESITVWVKVFDHGGNGIGDASEVTVPMTANIDCLKKTAIEEFKQPNVGANRVIICTEFPNDNEPAAKLVRDLLNVTYDKPIVLVLPNDEGI